MKKYRLSKPAIHRLLCAVLLLELLLMVWYLMSMPAYSSEKKAPVQQQAIKVALLASNLQDQDEYDFFILLRNLVLAKPGREAVLVSADGNHQTQLKQLKEQQPSDLVLVAPVNHEGMREPLRQLAGSTRVMVLGNPVEGCASVAYSNDTTALLVQQYISAGDHFSSQIGIVSSLDADSALRCTLDKIGSQMRRSQIAPKTPLLLQTSSKDRSELYRDLRLVSDCDLVVVMGRENIPEVLEFLRVSNFEGEIMVVGANPVYLSMMQDARLSAVVYQDPHELVRLVEKLVDDWMTTGQRPKTVECYQQLVTIHNINDYAGLTKTSHA